MPLFSRKETDHHHEKHIPGGRIIRHLVFGANDGLVATFAVVSGVHGAVESSTIIIVAGLAELIGGAISMALGAYLSVKSTFEYYEGERKKELYEMEYFPEKEEQEIREIYRAKDFEGQLLEDIVSHICSDKDRWLNIMMREELNISMEDDIAPIPSAFATGLSYVVGSAMPTLPYVLWDISTAFFLSILLTISTLFLVGAGKTFLTGKKWWISGLEAVIIGALAGTATYTIGSLFSV